MNRPDDLPDFANPPLREVSLGIQFSNLGAFRTIHSGAIWEAFRSSYPNVEEQPPLEPKFEVFGRQAGPNMPSIRFYDAISTPPRYWFLSEDRRNLLQFQSDRFHLNWRKFEDSTEYPRYESLKQQFIDSFSKLNSAIRDLSLGAIDVSQCEISYINQIYGPSKSHGVHTTPGRIFCIFDDKKLFDALKPEQVNMSWSSLLLREAMPVGRLHGHVAPQIDQAGAQTFRLTLTVRGLPASPTLDGSLDFFDWGREIIVKAFTNITTKEMHQTWERRK